MRSIGKLNLGELEEVDKRKKKVTMKEKTLGRVMMRFMISMTTMMKTETGMKTILAGDQNRVQDFLGRLKLEIKSQTIWKNARQLDLRREHERSVKRPWKSNAIP